MGVGMVELLILAVVVLGTLGAIAVVVLAAVVAGRRKDGLGQMPAGWLEQQTAPTESGPSAGQQ